MHDKDLTPQEFEQLANKFTKFIRKYFEELPEKPPLAQVEPGFVKKQIGEAFPEKGGNLNTVFDELEKIILPATTHWNHPRFMAYFNSTSTAPGILGEYLAAALNTNEMLWKTAPSSTELEETVLNWFRQMLGISDKFFPILYDTASVSSLHALAAAREFHFPGKVREEGIRALPPVAIYISEEAHSSIEKAVITLGLGLNSIRKIKTNENFSMKPDELHKAILQDEANGITPLAVVATVGTTSTTAIDPVRELAKIIEEKKIWLHVDAAYAGSAAVVPKVQAIITDAWETADSIVVNPHKWLFTPIDFSVLFVKHREILKSAFSIVPEYLKTNENNEVINYMDYGIQLGRRFRSLKFWLTLKYFGREGLAEVIRRHLRLAKKFELFIKNSDEFELLAPVNFSVVVFRAVLRSIEKSRLNEFNKQLLEEINRSGKIYLSHTVVKGKYALRLAISGVRTFEEDVEIAKNVIIKAYKQLQENKNLTK